MCQRSNLTTLLSLSKHFFYLYRFGSKVSNIEQLNFQSFRTRLLNYKCSVILTYFPRFLKLQLTDTGTVQARNQQAPL
jgi:hypothetical protein